MEKKKKKTWLNKLYKGLEIASDAADILVHIRAKPRLVDVASIGLKVVNSYKHHTTEEEKKERTEYFYEEGWIHIELWDFRNYLYKIAISDRFEQERIDDGRNEKFKDIVVNMYGIKMGWHKLDNSVHGPWIENSSQREAALAALGRAIWEDTGSCAIELVAKKPTLHEYGREAIFQVDNLKDDVYESEAANEILRRSKAFLDRDMNRSVMVYGPPGSGKSCAMRYVAREIGKHSLRINSNDLGNMYSEDLSLAIHLVKPEILIVDDFDRIFKPDGLLTSLEQFNSSIRLFMASVNNINSLDRAIIRPGRFDDIIHLTTIDKKIQDRLIGDGVPASVAAKLRKMPVAYIADFHKRKEVLGVKEAIAGVEDLQARIVEFTEGRRKKKKDGKKKKSKKKKLQSKPVDTPEGDG